MNYVGLISFIIHISCGNPCEESPRSIAFVKQMAMDSDSNLRNSIVFQRINTDEDLKKFIEEVEDPKGTTNICDYFYGRETEATYEVFHYDDVDIGYYLKNDETPYCFEITEKNLMTNEVFNDKKAVDKKELFNDSVKRLDTKHLPKKVNIEPLIHEGAPNIPHEQEPGPSNLERFSFSTGSTANQGLKTCKFICCPMRIQDVITEMKEKITELFNHDEVRFLEVELRCIITELFYINILLARSLLNLYPNVLESDTDNRQGILKALGYVQESQTTVSRDKKLFKELRQSFFVKRNKYQDLLKKWKKKTGREFVVEDPEMMMFQMKIDLINLVLFETLLFDHEPGFFKQ